MVMRTQPWSPKRAKQLLTRSWADREASPVAPPPFFCAARCGWRLSQLRDEIVQRRRVVLFVWRSDELRKVVTMGRGPGSIVRFKSKGRIKSQNWTRLEAEAHEASWGWRDENEQGRRSTTGWLQLDWPSETDTLKIDLPRDRNGCDRFECADKKLSTRRTHWCGDPSFIFIFWRVF